MSYQVHITSTAEHDIMRAADYIQFTLRNPDAADNLLDAATEQIGSLADLPQKFRLVDDPVLASWGIRFVIINNYLAFYTIDEEKVAMAALKSNEEQMKQNIKGALNVSEPSLKMFLEACVKDNKGIAYRYVGDTSGENIEYLFTVAELKELLSK